MEGVQGLAQKLMHRLVTASQQVLMLQLPAYAARTPARPVGIGVVRGSAWHILCAVDTGSVIVTPPPALAKYGRRWGWREPAGEPLDALAESLGALADDWWSKVPNTVGSLDVAGSITHAANVGLHHGRGGIGNIVYSDPGRHGAEETARVGIGRDRRDPLWPYLADVYAQEASILVQMPGRSVEIADVQQLARDMPSIIEHLSRVDDECEQWLAKLTALRPLVTEWVTANPPPVENTEWTVWASSEIKPGESPAIGLYAKAFSAERFYVTATPAADGAALTIGGDTLTVNAANAERIKAAIEREARDARDPEMSDWERYR